MFSIPVAGLAKTLLVVTIPLHPAAAHQAPAHYTVKAGDTLSSIAKHEYGSTADWPALWWVNRDKVSNPQVIMVGQKLKLSAWHPRKSWLNRAAMAAIPAPAPAPAEAAPAAAPVPVSAPVSTAPAASYNGASGSYQACVIQAESGGNPSAVNASSGAGGLYGFLPSTWQALGHSGLPENASVAEQNQAFQQEYAQGGTSAWSPYDGC
ncbi:MAG TPA: transglycosylase family protein [Streptosporangiaceae bacterium]|nr:transglycosylase family protein [Streptosporangiaceae bacterium]